MYAFAETYQIREDTFVKMTNLDSTSGTQSVEYANKSNQLNWNTRLLMVCLLLKENFVQYLIDWEGSGLGPAGCDFGQDDA